jgi:hypothetical protein
VAVTKARQSRPAIQPAKPNPKTCLTSFPARVVLRAVAATFNSYCQAFFFALLHDGHDQHFTVHPGRTRVICSCGVDQCL